MLTSLNRIAGLPVVWQDRQLGCVERADPGRIAPGGLRRRGGPQGHRRWRGGCLPASGIAVVRQHRACSAGAEAGAAARTAGRVPPCDALF